MAQINEEQPQAQAGEDEDSSVCVICCDVLEELSRAALDACSHCFHIDCIKQWANVKNECPLCKQKFLLIRFAGHELHVKDKTEEEDEEEEYDGEYDEYEEDVEAEVDEAFNECVVCFGMDGEDEAAKIDCRNGCGTWAHLACLELPMRPTDGWYCAECAALVNRRTRTRGTGIYRTMARESLRARTRQRRRRTARSAAEVDDEARQCRYADVTPTAPAPRPRISTTAPTAAPPRRPDPTLGEISSAYRAAALRAAEAIAPSVGLRASAAAQLPARPTAPSTTTATSAAAGPGVAVDAVASAVDEIMSGRRKQRAAAAARDLQGGTARDSSAQPQRFKRPRMSREGVPRSRSQAVLSELKQAIRILVSLKNVSPATAAGTATTDRATPLAPLRDAIQQHLPALCVEQDPTFLQELLDGGLLECLKEFLKPIAIGGSGTGAEATTFLPAKDRELLLRTLHSLPVRFEHIRKSPGMLRTLSSCVKLESSYRAQHGLVPALALRILRSWYSVVCGTQEEKAEFRAMTKSMRAAAPFPARSFLPPPRAASSSLPSYLRAPAASAPSFLSSSSAASAAAGPPPPSRTAGISSSRPSHRIERREATPP